jgi:hypothetical protein
VKKDKLDYRLMIQEDVLRTNFNVVDIIIFFSITTLLVAFFEINEFDLENIVNQKKLEGALSCIFLIYWSKFREKLMNISLIKKIVPNPKLKRKTSFLGTVAAGLVILGLISFSFTTYFHFNTPRNFKGISTEVLQVKTDKAIKNKILMDQLAYLLSVDPSKRKKGDKVTTEREFLENKRKIKEDILNRRDEIRAEVEINENELLKSFFVETQKKEDQFDLIVILVSIAFVFLGIGLNKYLAKLAITEKKTT